MKSTRGDVTTLVIVVLSLLGASQFVPNFRPWNWFKKGPPTTELRAAEDAATKARQAATDAEVKLATAIADFQAKKTDELRYSQQMLAGVVPALKRAPASAEVSLASSLAERAALGLSKAIGDLPADRQAEIMAIVEGALSAKQAEVDAAITNLKLIDAKLVIAETAKKVLEAQIPSLQAKAVSAERAKDAAQTVVSLKTAEVSAYADKAAAKEKEAGSLQAFVGNLLKLLALVAFIAVILGAGWLYHKFHSIGIAGLGSIVADIRAGVDPIHAIDTVTSPRVQAQVAKISKTP